MTFESLGLPEPLVRAVADAGYAAPTDVQSAAIPPALAGTGAAPPSALAWRFDSVTRSFQSGWRAFPPNPDSGSSVAT